MLIGVVGFTGVEAMSCGVLKKGGDVETYVGRYLCNTDKGEAGEGLI